MRELRRRRDLSLRQVAARSGISHTAISLIERNQISPSVDTLLAILDVLGTTITGFFSGLDRDAGSSPFYPKADMVEIGNEESISYRMLGVNQTDRHILMLVETYKPGASTGREITHPAQEAGVVVKGAIRLTVDGQSRVLYEGDGYYFDSSLPHQFENVADTCSEIISAVSPPTY